MEYLICIFINFCRIPLHIIDEFLIYLYRVFYILFIHLYEKVIMLSIKQKYSHKDVKIYFLFIIMPNYYFTIALIAETLTL